MSKWNIAMWALYGILSGAIVYSAFLSTESAYAFGACTAQECSAVEDTIAPAVCANLNSQVGYVNCQVGSTTWQAQCTNGYRFSGSC